MSYYIAKTVPKGAPQSYAFSDRKLHGLTQGKVSDLVCFGVPTNHEVAYDAYRANIDAFLYATLTEKKVATNKLRLPIDSTRYYPTNGLPLPDVAFQLKTKNLTEAHIEKFVASMGVFGMEEQVMSKSITVYTIKECGYATLTKLGKVCEMNSPTPKGYLTLNEAFAFRKLHTFIDLFCRTNTYPYDRGLYEDDNDKDKIAEGSEYKAYADGPEGPQYYNFKAKRALNVAIESRAKKIKDRETAVEEDTAMSERQASEEPKEIKQQEMATWSEVLVAKPSPVPADACMGPPSAVPYLPGICFPYFQGMLAPDPAFLKDILLAHFVRCMGDDEDEDSREAYLHFRRFIGKIASVPQGLVLQHVFKGMDLALQTQTQMFLMVDGGAYLGFNLLGQGYSIYNGEEMIWPERPAALTATIREDIWSHENVLAKILEVLNSMKMNGSDDEPMLDEDDVDSPLKLALVLGKFTFEKKADDQDQSKEDIICTVLERVCFDQKYKYRQLTIENIVLAIDLMTTNTDIPEDVNIYFPSSNLNAFQNKEFIVLSMFGPKTWSFRSSFGTVFKIEQLPEGGPDPLLANKAKEGEPAQIVMPIFVVSITTPFIAYGMWVKVLNDKAVRFDVGERAKESRCIVWKEKNRDIILAKLRSIQGVKAPKKTKGKGKAKAQEEVTADLFDSLFAD